MAMKFDVDRLVQRALKLRAGRLAGPQPEERNIGVSFTTIGIDETKMELDKLGDFISSNTARVVANIIGDLLARSVPRTPVDTGELRESGRAFLQFGHTFIDVAKGKKDGSVTLNTARLPKSGLKNARFIRGNVSFTRESNGKDIAVFTHEYLNPYGSGTSPKARTPGTGPKYLENPWNENKESYLEYARREIAGKGMETIMQKYLHKRTKRVKGFTLNYTELAFGGDLVYRGKI